MVHFMVCITCVFVSNGEYVANDHGEKELQTMVWNGDINVWDSRVGLWGECDLQEFPTTPD